MSLPEPKNKESFPRPPTAISSPAPVEMESSPPTLFRLCEDRYLPVVSKVISASSPKTMSFPMPVVIVSCPVPPITEFMPSPASMRSLPPRPEPVVITLIAPAAEISRRPASPSTKSLPDVVVIWSSATPPKTILSPAPAERMSLPPSCSALAKISIMLSEASL